MDISINKDAVNLTISSETVDLNYQFSLFYRIFIIEQDLIIEMMNSL